MCMIRFIYWGTYILRVTGGSPVDKYLSQMRDVGVVVVDGDEQWQSHFYCDVDVELQYNSGGVLWCCVRGFEGVKVCYEDVRVC